MWRWHRWHWSLKRTLQDPWREHPFIRRTSGIHLLSFSHCKPGCLLCKTNLIKKIPEVPKKSGLPNTHGLEENDFFPPPHPPQIQEALNNGYFPPEKLCENYLRRGALTPPHPHVLCSANHRVKRKATCLPWGNSSPWVRLGPKKSRAAIPFQMKEGH